MHSFRLPETADLHFLVPKRPKTSLQRPRHWHWRQCSRIQKQILDGFQISRLFIFYSQCTRSQWEILWEILLCPRQSEAGFNQRSRNIGWVFPIDSNHWKIPSKFSLFNNVSTICYALVKLWSQKKPHLYVHMGTRDILPKRVFVSQFSVTV